MPEYRIFLPGQVHVGLDERDEAAIEAALTAPAQWVVVAGIRVRPADVSAFQRILVVGHAPLPGDDYQDDDEWIIIDTVTGQEIQRSATRQGAVGDLVGLTQSVLDGARYGLQRVRSLLGG